MAKREAYWLNIGKWNGMRIRIRGWRRLSAADCGGPSAELWIDSDIVVPFESGRLPERLYMQIPVPWHHAKVADWVPFIRSAFLFQQYAR